MSILAECPICHKKQKLKNDKCACGVDLEKAKRSNRVKYHVSFRVDGKQRRECVGTSIEEARDLEGKRRGQKRENRFFDMLPRGDMSFKELTAWFVDLESVRVDTGKLSAGYYEIKKINLNSFNEIFGDRTVNTLKASDLTRYKALRKKAGLSDSYIDQQIGAAKSMIAAAYEDGKVNERTVVVFKHCKKLLKKGRNKRDRVLSPGEYRKLHESAPAHIKPIIEAAFWTGARRSELLKLTWDKVDIFRRIISLDASDTKEDKPKRIPISTPLQKTLIDMRKAAKSEFVFAYRGSPLRDIRDGLKRAADKAGMVYGRAGGFTLHDFRHTAKTFARKAGVDQNVRSAYFGHANADSMDARYDTIDDGDLIAAVDQIEAWIAKVDQTVDHDVDQIKKEA